MAATVSSRIVLLGASGQVGHDLAQTLPAIGHVVAPQRSELDLADFDAVRSFVRDSDPDIIVNAAAWTDVEGAETDEPGAFALNAELPRVLAEEAATREALLVHYSTDYVFDGSLQRPLRETDRVAPLNAYGRSKAAGEGAIAAVGGRYLILRLSWVYSARRRNFLKAIAERALRGESLRVVDDQIGTPTWSRAIAEATTTILQRGLMRNGALASGIYHLSSGEACSWADFADEIVAGLRPRGPGPVTRISSTEFATRAVRPRYSVLDVARVANDFGVRLPGWHAQLRDCLAGAELVGSEVTS